MEMEETWRFEIPSSSGLFSSESSLKNILPSLLLLRLASFQEIWQFNHGNEKHSSLQGLRQILRRGLPQWATPFSLFSGRLSESTPGLGPSAAPSQRQSHRDQTCSAQSASTRPEAD